MYQKTPLVTLTWGVFWHILAGCAGGFLVHFGFFGGTFRGGGGLLVLTFIRCCFSCILPAGGGCLGAGNITQIRADGFCSGGGGVTVGC